MAKHQRFHIRTLEQLRAMITERGLSLPLDEDLSALGEPVTIGSRTTANRFLVQPMEGFDSTPDGDPQQLSFRRYRRYAEGGSGLIWFEATAVVPEGRSNPGQLHITPNNVGTFQRLVSETKAAGREANGYEPLCILQITHSGRYSKPSGTPTPIIAQHNPILDPLHGLPADYPLVSDDYLDALQAKFVAAAGLAAQAGFDGVDVKSCHRYLLAELHGSFEREGRYGGSLENRTRLLRESLAAIKQAVPGLLITTRMNMYDALRYPYGFGVDAADYRVPDPTEPLQLIEWLRDIGVRLINISMGNPYFNPHYNRPYDFPIQGMDVPGEHPLDGVARLVGASRITQERFPDLAVVSSGYAWVRQFMPQLAAGLVNAGWATLVGQGRGAFAYPDSVRDVLHTGRMTPQKCCVTCSACTQIMRDGGQTGCVVRDAEIYGPKYREARRFALDHLAAEAQRCRDCEQATCTQGCPAQIDIPAFIQAFLDGDTAAAYEVLRAKNVLPEMCGSVCPACEQCEGRCLEQTFCEDPVPIQDIQLAVARTARLEGLTGVPLPRSPSGRRIAVIGGGPAGLGCAIKLLEAGHAVTILEKNQCLGGVPETTIPEDRFGSYVDEIGAVLGPAIDAGRLQVRCGAAIGGEADLAALREQFDAVFVGVGLPEATSLGQGKGVVGALQFLADAKAGNRAECPDRVAVLGAGNTAMDAATTALRLGARDVHLVYRRSFKEMPAWRQERDAYLNAGGNVLLLTQPVSYETDADGQLTGLRVARTELGEPDTSGRRRPLVIPNTEYVLPVDLIVEAMGQRLPDDVRDAFSGLEFASGGLLRVEPDTGRTNLPDVYAGGDLVNGGTTAVQGIVEGMRAAASINSDLASCAT